MTLAVDGSATLAYRVVFDGAPYVAVGLPEQVTYPPPDALTQCNIDGLWLKDSKFSIKADPKTAKLAVGGLTIKLVDVDNLWSQLFDTEPTARTWLAADAGVGDATITVASTEGFATTGTIWIDAEAITYTGKTGTTFTGCTRGAFSGDADAAQAHYASDSDRRRSPEITNWPVTWEGRRVTIYRYDETQLLTGSGTQFYRGLITTAPSFDGVTWSLGVDHMASVLEQSFGAGLTTPAAPRGIHYTTQTPFLMNIQQNTAGGASYVQFGVTLVGFYEDQPAFCTALTAAILAAIPAAANGTYTAVADGPAGWHLEYHTDAATVKESRVQIVNPASVIVGGGTTLALDPPLGAWEGSPDPTVPGPAPVPPGEWGYTQLANGQPFAYAFDTANILVVDTTYYFRRPMSGFSNFLPTAQGSVPRGAWSYNDNADGRTLYLGGAASIAADVTSVLIKGHDGDADYAELYNVVSVNVSARSIVLSPYSRGGHHFLSDHLPEIHLGLALQDTSAFPLPSGVSVANMLDFVAANQQQYNAIGVLPALRNEDFNTTRWHEIFDSLPPLHAQRVFTTFAPVSLGTIVEQELLAAGCFLSLDSTGRLIPARLRLPAQSELSAIATIDETTFLTDKNLGTHENNGYGLTNEIVYKTGFNPTTGAWEGPTINVFDLAGYGQGLATRAMEIGQLSQYVGPYFSAPAMYADVVALASPILGAISSRYSVDTIDAAKSEAVEVGAPILFSNPFLVDGSGLTGAGQPKAVLGMVGRVGLVMGKEYSAFDPRVTFTVMSTRQKIAGYAPGLFVTSQVNTSGNVWALTMNPGYLPAGSTAADFYKVGYAIGVFKFNATSSTPVFGTVTVASGNVITVDFGGSTWTPGASTWFLTFDSAHVCTSEQVSKFCFTADAAAVIDTGGPNFQGAKVLAP